MTHWWQREDLYYHNQQLHFADNPLTTYLNGFTTPLFVYSGSRISANIERLRQALKKMDTPTQLIYAMKANRNVSILHRMREKHLGIDACSPNEVRLALSCGFNPKDISLTGLLSPTELRECASIEGLTIHADSLNALEIIGSSSPGRKIGIRINPQSRAGALDNSMLNYSSSEKVSKFGVYASEFNKAREICKKYNLKVSSIHMHLGCGLLSNGLELLAQAFNKAKTMLDGFDDIEQINLGGGLGVPHTAEEKPLDLDTWVSVIKQVWADFSGTLIFEPGEYLVKDAGILLLDVNYQEQKNGKHFTYLNGGFNLAMEPGFYQLPCYPLSLIEPDQVQPSDVVGNINEALDVWMTDVPLPTLGEGDVIALINAGAYASSMASNHCMRGHFSERFIV